MEQALGIDEKGQPALAQGVDADVEFSALCIEPADAVEPALGRDGNAPVAAEDEGGCMTIMVPCAAAQRRCRGAAAGAGVIAVTRGGCRLPWPVCRMVYLQRLAHCAARDTL